MSKQDARITPIRTPATALPEVVGGARIGRIVAINEQGGLVVELPQGPHRVAKLAVALELDRIHAAIESRQPAVMVFENGDATFPIVIGLIEPATAVAEDQLRTETSEVGPVVEADVDGRRVRVAAKDEIVLECGQASITLRRNGRVLIRGTHVESQSEGANRIKGGQVRIN